MEIKKRNPYFDILKGVACIFVVFIHCQFPGNLGMVIGAIAKFAVPIFFMISGYYAVNNGKFNYRKKICRTLKMALLAELLFFSYEYLKSILMGDGWKGYLLETFNFNNFIQSILLNKPITYSHLWFLYALIYCYITLYFINKYKLYKTAIFLIVVGQVFFLLLGEVITILGYSYTFSLNIGDFLIEWVPFNMYIFRALPYVLLGYMYSNLLANLSFSKRTRYIMLIGGGIISIIERYTIGWFQFYFGTIFIVIALFSMAKEYGEKIVVNNNILKILKHIGECDSDFIYIIHILIASMLSTFMKLTGMADSDNVLFTIFSYFRPVLILLLSITCAEIRNRLLSCKGKLNE